MFYRLVDKVPLLCKTGKEWAEWYEAAAATGDRIVGRDELDGLLVSTMFTGIDPGIVDGAPPQLFETMTFVDGKSSGVTIRSATWEQAEREHHRLVRKMHEVDEVDA